MSAPVSTEMALFNQTIDRVRIVLGRAEAIAGTVFLTEVGVPEPIPLELVLGFTSLRPSPLGRSPSPLMTEIRWPHPDDTGHTAHVNQYAVRDGLLTTSTHYSKQPFDREAEPGRTLASVLGDPGLTMLRYTEGSYLLRALAHNLDTFRKA